MQLSKIKNKIVNPLRVIYKGYLSKVPLKFYNNLEVPIFAISDRVLIYYNNRFEQIFNKHFINECSFIRQNYVTHNNITYSKQKIYSESQIEVFQLIKGSTFIAPQNIIAHVLLDGSGEIIKSNAAFYKMLDMDQKKSEKDFFSYIDEKSREVLSDFLEGQSRGKKDPVLEIKFCNKTKITSLMYLLKISGEHLYNCYLVDITKYKNLELNFIHSQKMQAIGQLSGGIAHDFNNLLTAMLGFCDLLLIKHPAGDPSFAEIMQIKQNSNRAANLVRQLLALSRKQILKPKVLDITETIGELTNLIRRLIGNGIQLELNYANDLNPVKVDQGQLEQVIINLAVNARDAIIAAGGSGTITIRTKNVVIRSSDKRYHDLTSAVSNDKISVGRYVLIELSDNGIGIPQKIKDKIFEPFFSTKEIGSGTGLGLSTVYGIINQIGGHIYVDSKEGEGSKFYIYLKSFVDIDQEDENIQDMEDKLIQKDLTGDATILLVEDEAPVRMFSSHALTNKGYKIIEASNSEDALEVMENQGEDVDIIITDVIMPGMNGPSLISEIQKKYPKVKVIFISGYAEEAFSDAYGVDNDNDFNFLSKPFTLQQLVAKVKDVLDMKIKT